MAGAVGELGLVVATMGDVPGHQEHGLDRAVGGELGDEGRLAPHFGGVGSDGVLDGDGRPF